jgi:hypothetical protein
MYIGMMVRMAARNKLLCPNKTTKAKTADSCFGFYTKNIVDYHSKNCYVCIP